MRSIYDTIPPQELRVLYEQRGLSLRSVAKKYGCDTGVVARALRYHNIAIRHPTQALQLDVAHLRKLYGRDKLSTYKVATRYGCDPKTVYRYLKLNNIRTRSRKRIHITSSELRVLYVKERKSLREIGKAYDYSAAGILKKLKQFNIPRRTISETNTLHKKTDFSGNKAEKAYLIGFHIGDLGVRLQKNLIRISSGTTKTAQSQLIRHLFCAHGPVWIGRRNKRGALNVSCSMNRSFSFLLAKPRRIPRWILSSSSVFFAFLAGYTDAEGNISISQGKARFRLRSYDRGILRDIHAVLLRKGIHNLFYMCQPVGMWYGRKHNGDCWAVVLNDKQALYRLFVVLLPLLRHRKRKKDAEMAMKNVTRRLAHSQLRI